MVYSKKLRHLLTRALMAATPTLRDIAERVGVSYHTTRSWARGSRTPSPELRLKLARVLRKQATDLQKLAQRIEREKRET